MWSNGTWSIWVQVFLPDRTVNIHLEILVNKFRQNSSDMNNFVKYASICTEIMHLTWHRTVINYTPALSLPPVPSSGFSSGAPVCNKNSSVLTHWGRVKNICVSKLTIIGSDNGLSPGRRQAIIWINAGILLIGPLGTNFNEISIEIHTFSFKKMHLKMSSGKWQPCCLGLNVLKRAWRIYSHFYHFATLKWRRLMKSFPTEDKDPFSLHGPWHGNWCLGDSRSHGISSHSIDLDLSEYSVISNRKVNHCITMAS